MKLVWCTSPAIFALDHIESLANHLQFAERYFMPWIFLALTVILEVISAFTMKRFGGNETIFVLRFEVQSKVLLYGFLLPLLSLMRLVLFAMVVEKLDLSIAYAVRYGASIALVALVGFFAFSEAFSWIKLGALALTVIGLIGLSLSGVKY